LKFLDFFQYQQGKMKTISILFLIGLSSQLLGQDHWVFSPINTTHGLSDNRVQNICQLPDGRMVFVTEGLINLYDGSRFTYMHFNEQQAYALSNYFGTEHTYIDRNNNLWLKNHQKLFLFDLSTETFEPHIDSMLAKQGIDSHLTDLFMDSHLNFWYLTEDDRLYYSSSPDDKSRLFLENVSDLNGVTDKLFDIAVNDTSVFMFFRSGLMNCYQLKGKQLLYTEDAFNGKKSTNALTLRVIPHEHYLYQIRYNYQLQSTLLRFNIKTRTWEKLLKSTWQNALTIDSRDNCWVSLADGLWTSGIDLQSPRLISKFHLTDGSIYESEIFTHYIDINGGFWLAPENHGLLYYHPERFKFRNFGDSFFKPTNNNLAVNCLADLNGKILVGTQKGLYVYSEGERSIVLFSEKLADVQCNALFMDSKKQLWLCAGFDGLYRINGNQIVHYEFPFACQNLYESSNGNYYLCTSTGFGTLDPDSGTYENLETMEGIGPGYIFQLMDFGRDKLLGVAYGYAGLFVYNLKNKTLSYPEDEANWMLRHSNLKCHDMLTDHRGFIWFGTQDGLNMYNPHQNSLKRFYEEDGLVNNNVRSVIEDDSGRIWVSTANGISSISIAENNQTLDFTFINYNKFDGVIENEFLPRSKLITSDNRLLWGGLDGFNELNPERIDTSHQLTFPPLFTRFLLFGNEIKAGVKYDGDIILEKSISSTKKIDLKYFQNFFSFDFSALNYINPTQSYYRYKLEGVDASWNESASTDGIGHANYTNLSPGIYILKVYAANNGHKWGNKYAEISIVIHPPFWETPLAYSLYMVLFLGAFLFILRYYIKWNRKKIIKKQQEELDQMKLAFFTNISHELRTPLTLILTPLNSIITKQKEGSLKAKLLGIYRNAGDLLNLVNQILDFRKLEMKGETLQLNYCPVNEFLATIIQSFAESANEKRIKLTFNAESGNPYLYADSDKLQKIINNLLSNALKFTPEGGRVSLSAKKVSSEQAGEAKMIFEVSDNGCGIHENELLKIFERFYQIKSNGQSTGSGIGLHLIKQYVQLHKGNIEVKSQVGTGSTFIVEIPDQHMVSEIKGFIPDKRGNKSSVKLLVVEDNLKFREFLSKELMNFYNVITAVNGREGLQIAKEQQPDLVISDIMMPEMSGTELCEKLKNDMQISHIPVILLTAKTSETSQIEGLKAGADAYITKPFNLDTLLLRIQNLIEQQEKRRKLYRKEIHINPGSITITNLDEEIIRKALKHIEENIDNVEYSVEQLSKDMFMDRTNLYRKLSAIVAQTPTEFIRSVRLKHAARFLINGFPVSEVSEKVGFGTVSYFSKCFQKEFGMKPSQYKNAKAEKNNGE
jgi:signal transduction histidine kinase/DNA-binding response OmpR family regulator/ligand-binding sensor domain-containing protein